MSEGPSFQTSPGRRVLLVFPQYTKSFGTFDHAFPLLGVRAFMPPQGLLLIAALLPRHWQVRFVDENIRPMDAADLAWADVVFLSGMHLQRERIQILNQRAHQAGKLTVLGGPSVSAAPEFYPEVDLLHCGEAGDATWHLFAHLAHSVARPAKQRTFRTTEPLPLSQLPPPAYHLLRPGQYLMGCLQFSSGCPFVCEFCDIPALYGRRPRFKTPAQVLADLEQLRRLGLNSVYFVDDNFIAQPKATLALLPHLVAWQRQHAYPLRLACEATLNLAAYPEVLALMRQAGFVTVFCGIETPELTALRALKKTQNLRRPILESIQTLNRYGLEVAAGIILGLDTDTPDTAQAILNFARESQIPLLAVNLLYALPHTPLYERLQREGRLLSDSRGVTNIRFREPQETVLARWRQVIAHLYEPANLYERLQAQFRCTYPNRLVPEQRWRQLTWRNLRRAGLILSRILWHVGWRGHYRRQFWPLCWTLLRRGNLEGLFQANIVAHHLISYTREALQGKGQASNYSLQQVEAMEPHSAAH